MSILRNINVAIVGCGYWGPNLIRNFRALPGCHMRFMCDVSPQRIKHLKALYPDVEGRLDFAEVVNSPEVDAIAVRVATLDFGRESDDALLDVGL